MSTRETVIYLICGFGTLAMVVGAFGLFEAINGQSRGSRWAVPLIGLYAAGVVVSALGLTFAGSWYLAVPLALMVVPADVALRKHGFYRRRAADLRDFR